MPKKTDATFTAHLSPDPRKFAAVERNPPSLLAVGAMNAAASKPANVACAIEPCLESLVNELHDSCSVLRQAVEMMEMRLGTVLRPERPVASPLAAPADLPPALEAVDSARRSVATSVRMIHEILDRVAL